jgi:hypothetical protein
MRFGGCRTMNGPFCGPGLPEFDAAEWDRQLDRDVASGKLDGLANEAREDLRAGR